MAHSDYQSDRVSPKINRNHETFECASQAASNQSDNAGIEYGNDKGHSLFLNENNLTNQHLYLASKAGVTEEMLEDTLDMDEDEEIEEEADAEIEKVLFELTNGKLGEARSVGTELPVMRALYVFTMDLY